MVNIKEVKKIAKNENNPLLVPISYNDLKENLDIILKEFGNSGIIMFAEKTAVVYFDNSPNIRLSIKNKRNYVEKDFKTLEKNFQVIGQGPDKVPDLPILFMQDLKNNLGKILLILLLFCMAINPFSHNIEMLRFLDEKLIDILGMFIGMVFVFIGFFYGEKERIVAAYKKGRCYKEFVTDRYVINLVVLDIIILCASYLVSNISSADIPEWILNLHNFRSYFNGTSKYWLCFGLTALSIVILVIEFDALINYYLKDVRNKYFIDAFEESIKERKNRE